ncbi:hypothetical protein MmarC5_0250 [Methanococcus maripaludis C5]|uniref:Uncharacterized protein n=1 Tax=Methanococcus maripaludis (strain C5 / ATCC BAA-1333) TaxID=402880 RepID=A4FWJ1_METM5|nr:hypothetical protein [Methanococcus maripaludis]ABO34566.1 hypothetical protein MmarC5_0250 [Methanococcus maripaludis C5]
MIAFITEIPKNNHIFEDSSVYHVNSKLKEIAMDRIKYMMDSCKFDDSIENILDSNNIAYDSDDIDITISVGIETRKRHVLGLRLVKKSGYITYKMISQNSSKYDLNPVVSWEDEAF